MTEGQRTGLYRAMGDEDLLLYIGISKHFGKRWMQHAKESAWWPEARWMSVHWHDTREEAEAAEEAAIKTERPKYNKQHNVAVPQPATEIVDDRTAAERWQSRWIIGHLTPWDVAAVMAVAREDGRRTGRSCIDAGVACLRTKCDPGVPCLLDDPALSSSLFRRSA